MSQALIEHLQKNHGLPAEASEANAKKQGRQLVKAGTLTIAQYGELCAGRPISPAAPSADELLDAAEKAAQRINPREPDSEVQPKDIFGGERRTDVRVKRASEQYDTTKSRLVYPKEIKERVPHPRGGQDVRHEGRAAYAQSDCERAMAGAWFKFQLAGKNINALSDHDQDLLRECLEKAEWVGEITVPGQGRAYHNSPIKLNALQQKTLLNDSTSGGQSAVPYAFDVELVTFPLLYGELFPYVTLKQLDTSNQVKGATLSNMTISAGPAEGDSPTISLQTTSSIMTALTTTVYNATGAITIGRDFLADSPIDLQDDIITLYQKALLQWLDKEVATGDGTTGPLGLGNVSGANTYTAANSTAGPWTVTDSEGMLKSLPKQYRPKSAPVIFVASDGLYFRIRKISVTSSDQRRIFGYDYENYTHLNRPFKVENDISGSNIFLANMMYYWMYQRKGFDIQISDDGRTNMLANERLIVCRSRWGGNFVVPAGMVQCTNATLH